MSELGGPGGVSGKLEGSPCHVGAPKAAADGGPGNAGQYFKTSWKSGFFNEESPPASWEETFSLERVSSGL